MTRRVAIIHVHDTSYNDDNAYCTNTQLIADSITDWAEVNDEDYEILKRALPCGRRILIERLPDNVIPETVAAFIEQQKKYEVQMAKEAQRRAEVKAARAAKKAAKDEMSKRALYERLKKELED